MTRKFYFAELHIGSSIRYRNTLFGNYFSQMLHSQNNSNISEYI